MARKVKFETLRLFRNLHGSGLTKGAVALVIYIRITFFYTRVTYLHRTQVCLTRHTDVHKHRSFHLHSIVIPKDTMRISFSPTTRICGYVTNLKVVDSPNFPANLKQHCSAALLYSTVRLCIFLPWRQKCIFDLTTLTKKTWNCNKLNSRASYSPQVGKKRRRLTSSITDCRAFPKLIFLRCYSCWRSRIPPLACPPHPPAPVRPPLLLCHGRALNFQQGL